MIPEAEKFLRAYRRKRAETTVRSTRSDLKQFSAFLDEWDLSVANCTWDDLEEYLYQMKEEDYSDHTIRNRYQSINQLYQYLQRKDIVDHNPADEVEIREFASRKNKREEKTMEKRVWLTREEINQLVDAAPQPVVRNRCIILFMYYTACRRSEVSKVKLENMDFDQRKAKVKNPKTEKIITVRWQENLDPLLRTWVEQYRPAHLTASESPYLFVTEQAESIAPNHISRMIRNAAENAGIQEILYEDKAGNKRRKVTSHALRHSFAVHWLQPPNKGSLEELKEILAHKDVTTTQIYADMVGDQVDESYRAHAGTIDYDGVQGSNSQVCELCGEQKPRLVTHHTSYNPEETMDVCQNCHSEIHGGDRYPHLQPDETREEAEGRGWTPR